MRRIQTGKFLLGRVNTNCHVRIWCYFEALQGAFPKEYREYFKEKQRGWAS